MTTLLDVWLVLAVLIAVFVIVTLLPSVGLPRLSDRLDEEDPFHG